MFQEILHSLPTTRMENWKGLCAFMWMIYFVAGSSAFRNIFLHEVSRKFKFSKVESNRFKYLGCQVEKLANGDIELNQNDNIASIDEVEVTSKSNSCPVNEAERKTIRRVVGELLWVSLMTRPDLSFEVNRLSSNISVATVKDVKDAKRLVERAKKEPRL